MKKTYCFLTVLIALIVVSCKKDDETITKKQPLITIKNHESYVDNIYLLVSGLDGSILNSTLISGTTDTTLYSDIDYKMDNINVSVIVKFPNSVSAFTYINLKKGGYFSPFRIPKQHSFKDCTINLNNTTGVDRFSLSFLTGNYDNITKYNPFTIRYELGSMLYISKTIGTAEYYDFIPIGDKGEFTLDFSKINEPFLEKEVAFPITHMGGYYSILGRTEEGYKSSQYWLGNRYVYPGSKSYLVPYPGSTFVEYLFTSELKISENETKIMTTAGELPSAFVPLNATVKIEDNNPVNFKIAPTGTFDSYNVTFESADKKGRIIVYCQSSLTNFILPEIGNLVGRPELKTSDFNLTELSLNDYDNYVDEPSYFKLENEGNGHETTEKSKLKLTNKYTY